MADKRSALPNGALVTLAVAQNTKNARRKIFSAKAQPQASGVAQAHTKAATGDFKATLRISQRMLKEDGIGSKDSAVNILLRDHSCT